MSTPSPDAKSIFLTAADMNVPADRAAYLQQACGGDDAVRRRVEALLKAHEASGGFLDAPAAPGAVQATTSLPARWRCGGALGCSARRSHAPAAAPPPTRAACEPGCTPWPVPEQGGWQAHIWNTSFSPDGRTYLASGDSGPRGIARLWDLDTGKLLQEFRTEKDVWFNNSAAFLPNGEQIVTAYSNDKNIYFWDVATGKLVREFQGHTAVGVTAFVSHDGRSLVSYGKDNRLRLWDMAKSQEVWTQDVSGEEIARVVFSPDDSLLLTSGADRILRVRELSTGAVARKLEGHTAPCAADFSPDGKQVLSWSEGGQIRLWDVDTAKTLHLFDGRPEAIRKAWYLDDGRQVLTWGKDLVFRIWDAKTGEKLREVTVSEMTLPGWNEAVVSPDGQRLLVVNSDAAGVRLVDMISGAELYRSASGKLPNVRGFTFAPDGRHVAAGSFRKGVYLLELPVPAAEGSLQTPSQPAKSLPRD